MDRFGKKSIRGNPFVWLLFVRQNGLEWQLRAVCSSEARAATYSKMLRQQAKEQDARVQIRIEKAETDHLYAASFFDHDLFSVSPERFEKLRQAGLV